MIENSSLEAASQLLSYSFSQPKTNSISFSNPINSNSELLSLTFGGQPSISNTMEQLLNAQAEALVISDTAANLSSVYTELQSSGFRGSEVTDFVTASESLNEEQLTAYLDIANDVNAVAGNDVMVDWVNKASELLLKDNSEGSSFMDRTKSLLAENVEDNSVTTESITDLISQYS
jgi:hypothetical protein